MEPRQVKSRPETLARRIEILDAAVEIFGTRGYTGSSLGEIADRVGMTHAGVLHHFGSKDALLLEVLAHRDRTDVAHLEGKHIPGGLDLFRHLVKTALLNSQRAGIVQAFAVLSAESVTDGHPGRAYFEERYRVLRGEIDNAFRAICRERGIEAPASVDAASSSILAVMDGLQVQWLLDPTSLDLSRSTTFAIEAIVRAIIGPDVTLDGH